MCSGTGGEDGRDERERLRDEVFVSGFLAGSCGSSEAKLGMLTSARWSGVLATPGSFTRIKTASPPQIIFKIRSSRSGGTAFPFLFPLLEIEDDELDVEFEFALLARIDRELKRIDDQRIAEGFELVDQ